MVAMQIRSYESVSPSRWRIHLQPEAEMVGHMLHRLRRVERGWTQLQLAARLYPERVGNSQEMSALQTKLSRYERNNVRDMDPDVVMRLERLYGLPENTIRDAMWRTRQQLEQREQIPDDSFVIGPVSPELAELFEELDPIEDEQLPEIIHLIRHVREVDPTGATWRERMKGFERYLKNEKRDGGR